MAAVRGMALAPTVLPTVSPTVRPAPSAAHDTTRAAARPTPSPAVVARASDATSGDTPFEVRVGHISLETEGKTELPAFYVDETNPEEHAHAPRQTGGPHPGGTNHISLCSRVIHAFLGPPSPVPTQKADPDDHGGAVAAAEHGHSTRGGLVFTRSEDDEAWSDDGFRWRSSVFAAGLCMGLAFTILHQILIWAEIRSPPGLKPAGHDGVPFQLLVRFLGAILTGLILVLNQRYKMRRSTSASLLHAVAHLGGLCTISFILLSGTSWTSIDGKVRTGVYERVHRVNGSSRGRIFYTLRWT